MARSPKPVPLALRHRRDWSRRLGRYCICGLRWRCPDRLNRVPVEPVPGTPPAARRLARVRR
ncbi:hypothetical protein [Micromonospora cathayae]|uniref:Uncharacterized protein n=1 Tax=Micromonospora cathayae TaxID=3028804 RepID=A0ABY7ZYF7_9ACTN|nr:hypothetical protein [Micromonospora sp. HUAS 3]WDZ87483.1 hypothetical protein PVK37_14260 [Micromonospora sp. HUAS 3]